MIKTLEYDANCDFDIMGVSYIGRPKSGTAMFLVKKLEPMLQNLNAVEGCLVFIGQDVEVPAELLGRHCFVRCPNPTAEYGRLTQKLWAEMQKTEQQRPYTQMPGGYTLGENVSMGQGVLIEPGAFIGHDVVLGNGCAVLAGAVVRSAVLGANCLVKESAIVGCLAFTQWQDEDGHNHRLYNLGKVVLEHDVEVGAGTSVCRGSADDTVLRAYTKLDDHVYIAHDVECEEDVRLTSGVTVGGYCTIGRGTFVGFNATLRNRIAIGRGCTIGMGSVVTKNVPDGATVYGVPAKEAP